MRITVFQNEVCQPIELTEADNIVLTIPDSKVKNVLVALGEAAARGEDLKLHLVQGWYEVAPVGAAPPAPWLAAERQRGVLGGIR